MKSYFELVKTFVHAFLRELHTLCACCTAFYNITVAVVEEFFVESGQAHYPLTIRPPRLLHRFFINNQTLYEDEF